MSKRNIKGYLSFELYIVMLMVMVVLIIALVQDEVVTDDESNKSVIKINNMIKTKEK